MSLTRVFAEYIILNTILFTAIFFLNSYSPYRNKKKYPDKDNKYIKSRSKMIVPLTISLIILFSWLVYTQFVIGFLPYGPDTNSYTYAWQYINSNHHWDHEIAKHYNPYYYTIHIVIMFSAIFNTVIGINPAITYTMLQSSLLAVMFMVSFSILKRFFKYVNVILIAPLVIVAVFLITPPLGGLDIIPQYYSIILSSVIILLIFIDRVMKVNNILTIIILTITSIMSHLSSIILLLTFILAFIVAPNNYFRSDNYIKKLKTIMTLNIGIAINYVLFTSAYLSLGALGPISKILIKIIFGGLEGSRLITRAYNEIPNSKVWLYSWSFLPSIGIAYILYILMLVGLNFLKKKDRLFGLVFNDFKFVLYFLSLIELGVATLLRFSGYDIFRYILVPSYYALYYASIIALMELLAPILKYNKVGKSNRAKITLIFLLILIIAGLYSGIQDPGRLPWNGGLRLAPTTWHTREELKPIAIYAPTRLQVFAWHGAYVPIEFNPKMEIITGQSYYPIHDLLQRIADGYKFTGEYKITTIYIIPKKIVKIRAYTNYNLLFNMRYYSVFYEN